jgi:hypothetical protein
MEQPSDPHAPGNSKATYGMGGRAISKTEGNGMGQYFKIVNLDKHQYLHPHRLGNGLKLLEFGASKESTMSALVLLCVDNDDGHNKDLVGSWCGDRIAILGDNGPGCAGIMYEQIRDFEDISLRMRETLQAIGLKPGRRWDV